MVQQQAGEYIEIHLPHVTYDWYCAVPTTGPEIESEEVWIQYSPLRMTPFLKTASYKVLTSDEKLLNVLVRGPFGMAACDVLRHPILPPPRSPPDHARGTQDGVSGKILLAADEQGLPHLAAVLNDLYSTLKKVNEHKRDDVSRLHPLFVDLLHTSAQRALGSAPERPKLCVCIIAACRAADGYKRFMEVCMKLMLLMGEKKPQPGTADVTGAWSGRVVPVEGGEGMSISLQLRVHATCAASAGLAMASYKRLHQLGKVKGKGHYFARKQELLTQHVAYGPLDWNMVLRQLRYEWLNEQVDVLHWGQDPMDELKRACAAHSHPDLRKVELRPQDRTIFRFHHGYTPNAIELHQR